jgi:hypothetical protein
MHPVSLCLLARIPPHTTIKKIERKKISKRKKQKTKKQKHTHTQHTKQLLQQEGPSRLKIH